MQRNSATLPAFSVLPPSVSKQKHLEPNKPIRVLLVEDDPEAAELVQIGLLDDREGPFEIDWSQNLFDAMSRLTSTNIDVVLLDLGLPELSGYKSYRAIEAASRGRVPVVIFTSDERSSTRQITLQFGAADYLLKSENSPAQLREALRNAVGNPGGPAPRTRPVA